LSLKFMSSDYITLYDIPGTSPSAKGWSINMWKARYALNYKGIPYKTTWVEYVDIESTFKGAEIAPTAKKADGSDQYTCPAISDPAGPFRTTDSLRIVEYLDKAYPKIPLFPHGTKGLQKVFMDEVDQRMVVPLMPLLLVDSWKQLNTASSEYFRETREKRFGKKMEEFCPEGPEREAAYKKAETGFSKIASYLDENGDAPFVTGNEIVYADLYLGSFLKWMKTVSENEVWAKVSTWNCGRWAKLSETLDSKYGQVL